MIRILLILSNNSYDINKANFDVEKVLTDSDLNMIYEAKSLVDNYRIDLLQLHYDDKKALPVMREALSYGLDNAYYYEIREKEFTSYETLSYLTSKILGESFSKYDLYLLPRLDYEGDNVFFANHLANYLKVPVLSYVEEFKIEDRKVLASQSVDKDYRLEIEGKFPIVIHSINENAEKIYPKIQNILRAYDEGAIDKRIYSYENFIKDFGEEKVKMIGQEEISSIEERNFVELIEKEDNSFGQQIINILREAGF